MQLSSLFTQMSMDQSHGNFQNSKKKCPGQEEDEKSSSIPQIRNIPEPSMWPLKNHILNNEWKLKTSLACVTTGFHDSHKQTYIMNLITSCFYYFQKAKKKNHILKAVGKFKMSFTWSNTGI